MCLCAIPNNILSLYTARDITYSAHLCQENRVIITHDYRVNLMYLVTYNLYLTVRVGTTRTTVQNVYEVWKVSEQ